MSGTKRDVKKERYWERAIREAVRSEVSIREFCRQRKLNVSQFYWWQRRLKETRTAQKGTADVEATSFALVSEERGAIAAGIELILNDGRRLRIGKGVDEETLRAVLAVMESTGC